MCIDSYIIICMKNHVESLFHINMHVETHKKPYVMSELKNNSCLIFFWLAYK